MDWEPNERDAWVVDAQRWIEQVNSVLQCKIDLDSAGEITRVHVVAGMEREPRHIVRDVESLLKARLDLEIFYKKIGVVQVLNDGQELTDFSEGGRKAVPAAAPHDASPGPAVVADAPEFSAASGPLPADPPAIDDSSLLQPAVLLTEDLAPRVVCSEVGVMAAEMRVRAEVLLRAGDLEARGVSEGPNHDDSDLRLVGQATLAAIHQLLVDPVLLDLHEIEIQQVGGHAIILTAVNLIEGRQGVVLFGTCLARPNRQQAVVYSILDALNRRLALFPLKCEEAGA